MTYPACVDCGEPDSGSCPDGRCRDCDIEHLFKTWPECECGAPSISDWAQDLGVEERHAWDCPNRPLRVLLCGSRSWNDAEAIAEELARLPRRSTVVHGACPAGADALAGIEVRSSCRKERP